MKKTLAVGGLVALAALAGGAAPPAEGPARTAAGLEQAVQAGRFEEAERLARQLVALREQAHGKSHWRVTEVRLRAERWARLTRVPARDRPAACSTGQGPDTQGEGLLGFSHAFLQAGARSVVLSRWKVDDVATALLMMRFYEDLLGSRKGTKPMGRAAALEEARRWLRTLGRAEAGALAAAHAGGALRGTEKPSLPVKAKSPLPAGDRPFAHPCYWAAFVLIGDPD